MVAAARVGHFSVRSRRVYFSNRFERRVSTILVEHGYPINVCVRLFGDCRVELGDFSIFHWLVGDYGFARSRVVDRRPRFRDILDVCVRDKWGGRGGGWFFRNVLSFKGGCVVGVCF